MGRDRQVKTYSRHHGSRVVTVDKGLWESSGDQQKHLFSLSLESSINSSDSLDRRVTRSTRKTGKNKENAKTSYSRRVIGRKKYGSDMESSGTGSDSIFSSGRPRRALRDRSNIKVNGVQKGKRKRQPASPLVVKPERKNTENSYNFSEFDDYSLCISGTPPKGSNDKSLSNIGSNVTKKDDRIKSNIIETSTPLAKRTRSYVSFSKDDTGSCADISLIGSVENSPSVMTSDLELGSSNFGTSPVIVNSSITDSNKKTEKSNIVQDLQLQKLRNSLLMMHISGRKDKKLSLSHASSQFDQSASLFSSVTDSRTEGNESDDEFSEEEEEEESSDETEDENDDDEDDLYDIKEDEEVEEEENNEDHHSSENNSVEINERLSSGSESLDKSSTRYMINDVSEYATAHSSTSDMSDACKSYHTAEDRSMYGQGVKSPGDLFSPRVTRGRLKTPTTSPKLQNKSLGNLKSSNKSLIVMLTPVKNKDPSKKDKCMSPKSKVFQICQHDEPISFKSCITASMMRVSTKVGEGVYGEVFRTQNNGQSVALKVIPIEGDFDVNDEPQKTYEGMLPEIVISKELSLLRSNKKSTTENFCEVNSVSCVKGRYPKELLKQWDDYHEEKESQNDRPDVFTDEQLFIVFEFADGGKDLESAKFHNIFEAKSVLQQVAFSLAVAEEVLQFEHRDLHWGNVLVQKTKKTCLKYRLMGQDYTVDSHKVFVSIIDFTLSRLHTDGVTTYSDLSTDETLFQGEGDYQFDIYRKMKEENGNNWEKFNPKSNVWWLHYLTEKLIRNKRYTRNTKEDQAVFRQMRLFMKEIPNFSSACELVTCSEFFDS